MAQFVVAKGSNPSYMIMISCPTAGLELVADLPEQTVLALQSDWETRMSSSFFPQAVTTVTGVSPLSQEWNTRQMWVSTSPIELSFHLLFDAQKSAHQDVFLPAMALLQLVAPDSVGDLLLPPGPSRIDKQKNAVTLAVGNMFRIEDAIIVSAQPTFDNRMDATGYPIACDMEITIRTAIVYSRNDIKKMISSATQGGGG